MKFLIFCGYLGPKLNANNKIAYTIAEQFALKGHSITLAGINTDETAFATQIESSADGKIRYIYITPNDYYLKEREKLSKSLAKGRSRIVSAATYCLAHPVSAAKALYSYTPFYKNASPESEAAHFLNQLCSKENFDCVFAVTFPKFTLPVVFDGIKSDCKKAIYQLDPLGVHEDNTDLNRDELRQFELKYFRQADYIFTTDILNDLYLKTEGYSEFSNKIYTAQFPTLLECHGEDYMPLSLCSDKTNIVFCGTVDDRYRSPEIFLRCMEKIWTAEKNIAIHFVGINNSRLTLQYADKYPDNVFIHSRIDTAHVPALLSKADILLNIGNTYRLQVPSKIFEYFATGKPIIHQQIIDDCTCKAYMDKYPLAFSLNDVSDATADKLHAFIKNAVGQSLSFSQIEQLFSDSTPQYVSEKMLDILTTL